MAVINDPFVRERSQFRSLLASNPNYFGNLEKFEQPPVTKIINNVTYEEISCVGFNPDFNNVQAVIQIKQPTGYAGDLCSGGSTEFVRFFLDYGSGWVDQGVVGTKVHDIPNQNDCGNQPEKPLSYVVSLPIKPRTDYCGRPVLPNVRAVLSWEVVPSVNPSIPPIWGNVVDRHIQIKPRPSRYIDLPSILGSEVKLPPIFETVQFQPIPLPDPAPETFAELAKTYAASPAAGIASKATISVEAHRFGFSQLLSALESPAPSQELLAAQIQEFAVSKVNWNDALAALQKTSGNTTYEQLNCVGLDNNREWLVASFTIKRPSGFNGQPCQAGSKEYVSFWVDYDNTCKWTYAGTVSVAVHDYASFPADGLHYTAIRPVDLSAEHRSCDQPRIARVRAVLSWNTPPSTVDPDAVPYWGNRVDTHVQINPGAPTQPGQRISILGGIGVAEIDALGAGASGLTLPNAKFALYGSYADPYYTTRQCPFGGQITIQGPGTPYVGTFYRIWVRPNPLESFQVLHNSIYVVDQFGNGSTIAPDANGFFAYLNYLQNVDQTLGYWYASGGELGELYLEFTNSAKTPIGVTAGYQLQLKSSAPNAQITLDAGGCHMFHPGDAISGHFVATDPYFGHWVLSTLPASLNPPAPQPVIPLATYSQTSSAPGDQWTLDSHALVTCGYVVRVEVWDRTIVGSYPASHNYLPDDLGFCLLPN